MEPRLSVTKEEFCSFCHLLYNRHLVSGVGGNMAARMGRRIITTPSGYSLRDVVPETVVTVDEQGRIVEGPRPTKDLDMHLKVLNARPDINVVCHT
ncbi:MAG: class II aldolase/adducin family protein, partial [Deltaproteobacteria bacterium]